MSLAIAAVLVVPPDRSSADVVEALPVDLRPVGEATETSWGVPGLANGRFSYSVSPMGFVLLTLTFSGTQALEDPGRVDAILEKVRELGERLGARFGYLTRYEHEFGGDWQEQNVLVPLLIEEPDLIPQRGFERVLIAPR